MVATWCTRHPFALSSFAACKPVKLQRCSASRLVNCSSCASQSMAQQPAPSSTQHSLPLESGANGCYPPPTTEVRVTGRVKVHEWQDIAQREAALTELQAFCTASINRLRLEAFKPILLKGAVADWPAVDKWSLDWLVQQYGEQRCEQRHRCALHMLNHASCPSI
ncbi:hypothetical protein ABBQ38_009283 [Trebouxia sp. C0009 RCD-2024]